MRILNYSNTIQDLFKHLKESAYPINQLNVVYDNSDREHADLQKELTSIDSQQLIIDLADYLTDNANFNKQLYEIINPFNNKPMTVDENNSFRDYDSDNKYLKYVFTMDEIKQLGEQYVQFACPYHKQ